MADQPETPATDTPAAAATPAAVKAPPTLTQEQVNDIVRARLDEARKAWEKETPKTDPTVEQKVADLEARTAKAEAAAVAAIVARAAADAHDPETVAKLVDLDGLGATDGPAIAAKVAEYLTAHPYLVKAPAAPDTTPSPGVTTGGGPKLLTADQLAAMTPEELTDPEKLKLYTESRKALRG